MLVPLRPGLTIEFSIAANCMRPDGAGLRYMCAIRDRFIKPFSIMFNQTF